ncbi:biotin transporter BioY [Lacticigenium naphthae]|uniref:biotin transporter BioY n=1 Tax=Lacticigenium naphthae TaxID=515351 RepID=UPI0004126988|nr:biotin transporter BioY [Lacticigenium naphthae]
MKLNHSKSIVLSALMVALLGIFSVVIFPIGPVPITLQTFFFIFIPLLLGWKKGVMTIAAYVFLGLLGFPVFAGGIGGLHSIFRPSFGYLLGALLAAPLIGSQANKEDSFIKIIVVALIGLGIIYFSGINYTYWILNLVQGNPISWKVVASGSILSFLPLDSLKVVGAVLVYKRLPRKFRQLK